MNVLLRSLLVISAVLITSRASADDVLTYRIEPSDKPGQLSIPADYRIWLPPKAEHIRGIIVHQHGCGDGAERGGETAAHDLHWRALAQRWDCALLAPRYHAGGDCRQWYDPTLGSAAALQKALGHFAMASKHPELATAPWALWGHSGGAVWAFRMFNSNPDRTIAVFLRSGRPTLFTSSEDEGEIPPLTPAKRQVPIVSNLGLKERDHERFSRAWNASWRFFQDWRPQGARLTWAPDPLTSHECGNSRFLAIPFFDACLAARLSEDPQADGLGEMNTSAAWLGNNETHEIAAASDDPDFSSASWLPNEHMARVWREFVTTGEVADETPPKHRPTLVSAGLDAAGRPRITWTARPDWESGIRGFRIYRDGRPIAMVTSEAPRRFGIEQFQQLSYHDTPTPPLPEMVFVDDAELSAEVHRYGVVTINGYGLGSGRPEPVEIRVGKVVEVPEDAQRTRPAGDVPENVSARLAVPYARYGDRTLELDLFTPADVEKPRPAIVVVHGGGWKNGDRSKFRRLALELAACGYVTAAISYRLSGEAPFPAAIHDCKAAVRYLRANAAELKIDPDRIGVVGGSAGGHLAALLGTSHGVEELEGNGGHAKASSRVQAVAVMGGPVDLESEHFVHRSLRRQGTSANAFLGGNYEEAGDTYRAASPIRYLEAGDPPFLLIDGGLDRPGERYAAFIPRADEAGIRTQFVVVQHGEHGCWNFDPWFSQFVEELDRFFGETLGDQRSSPDTDAAEP
ncbi:Carboxylesterase NlhH [Maioricimonas rarisocia]|uniref:Carboxylesterase NlhH n=1 Tax=Maioricimonas rarisocia TaxID=2528026 RepID=A0A517ZFR8_9PLAN|nr:alpha/beta hydrolase [Maioricimonas rarisocia]QDU41328.1 Carboxylesterase NlhH [Maioricimonas rarisocia]